MTSYAYSKTKVWDRRVDLWIEGITRDVMDIIEEGLREIVERLAPQILQWMKDNALWKDQTGNARKKLKADVKIAVHKAYDIVLDHGVPYGVHLELKYQGRYAILHPALDYWFPILKEEVRKFVTS